MMNLGRHGVFATLRKTRGRGTEEALQPGKSFASEAESIDSHIAKNGLESGNLSEQSSIHSDDVSVGKCHRRDKWSLHCEG